MCDRAKEQNACIHISAYFLDISSEFVKKSDRTTEYLKLVYVSCLKHVKKLTVQLMPKIPIPLTRATVMRYSTLFMSPVSDFFFIMADQCICFRAK